MMIDPNKTYRTRDGRPVRIYATDGGGPFPVHGAIWMDERWSVKDWSHYGSRVCCEEPVGSDLIEVTLAEELRDQIPWEALRPEIRWAAMDGDSFSNRGKWWGFRKEPRVLEGCDGWMISPDEHNAAKRLDAVNMPEVASDRWAETLIERPEDK